MPIAPFEKAILRLLAVNRNPESFVAGATVLLRPEDSHRRSQDVDLFHDTADSLKLAAEADDAVLAQNGYDVVWDHVQPTFRRALVRRDGQITKLEWVFDSAFRFFPVERDDESATRSISGTPPPTKCWPWRAAENFVIIWMCWN